MRLTRDKCVLELTQSIFHGDRTIIILINLVKRRSSRERYVAPLKKYPPDILTY